jgi:YD repeat-containing protein
VGYAYDEVGNRIQRQTGAGNTVAFAYDLRDQLIEVGINDEAPITLERDVLGRTTREQLPDPQVRLQRWQLHFADSLALSLEDLVRRT